MEERAEEFGFPAGATIRKHVRAVHQVHESLPVFSSPSWLKLANCKGRKNSPQSPRGLQVY